MLEEFKSFLERQDVSSFDTRFMLAVSGGVDSVVMAHLFHMTGFRFPGEWTTPPPCNPPDVCISGYFTEFVFGNATGGGGTDLGANAVWLVS